MKEKLASFCKKYSAVLFFISLGITCVIEAFSRHDLFGGVRYCFEHPLLFLYNALFIFATLHVSILFKRRVLATAFISFVWLCFGFVNFLVLFFRTTPFSAVDFRLIDNAIDVVTLYLDLWQLILIILALVALLVWVIHYFAKKESGDRKVHYVQSGALVALILVAVIGSRSLAIQTGLLPSTYANIAQAFEDYGFAYCFSSSVLDTGINRPSDYSEEAIGAISDKVNFKEHSAAATPNIILVQLESVADPYNFKGLNFSQDPIPNLHALYQNYSSGALTVPSIGAGTANTEYEVLAGVPLKFFGTGEYPYKTILDKDTAESLAYDLKSLGYSTHALHNNVASFYSRNLVFSHLGFDTFTSSEFMSDITYNSLEWAHDAILTRYVIEALDYNDQKDFVFTISVQSHGKYPTDYKGEMPITLSGELAASDMQYYVNELAAVDKWVGELIDAVEKRGEDTVIIFYGDHYPTLGLEQEDLNHHTLYETQYVIWDNIGLQKQDKDMHTYQLGSYVFERLGITGGLITQLHTSQMGEPTYEDDLKMLAYDMMYGDKYSLGGVNPFGATELVYGCTDVTIGGYQVNEQDGLLVVNGNHFTAHTHIVLGEDVIDTTYVNETTLTVPLDKVDLSDFDPALLGVAVCNGKGTPLSPISYLPK